MAVFVVVVVECKNKQTTICERIKKINIHEQNRMIGALFVQLFVFVSCQQCSVDTSMLQQQLSNVTLSATTVSFGPAWFGGIASLEIRNIGTAVKPLVLRGPFVFANRSSLIVFNSYVVLVGTITLLDEAQAELMYSQTNLVGATKLVACSMAQLRFKETVLARNGNMSNSIELWQFDRSFLTIENIFGASNDGNALLVDLHLEVCFLYLPFFFITNDRSLLTLPLFQPCL